MKSGRRTLVRMHEGSRSDAELIDAFLRRERSAADELYRRFAPRVFGLGMVMLGNPG